MAGVPLLTGFNIGSTSPVDYRLIKTKAEMKAADETTLPDVYLTICPDDGKLYLYNKENETDSTTGKFKVFEGGSLPDYLGSVQYKSQGVFTDNVYVHAPSNMALFNNWLNRLSTTVRVGYYESSSSRVCFEFSPTNVKFMRYYTSYEDPVGYILATKQDDKWVWNEKNADLLNNHNDISAIHIIPDDLVGTEFNVKDSDAVSLVNLISDFYVKTTLSEQLRHSNIKISAKDGNGLVNISGSADAAEDGLFAAGGAANLVPTEWNPGVGYPTDTSKLYVASRTAYINGNSNNKNIKAGTIIIYNGTDWIPINDNLGSLDVDKLNVHNSITSTVANYNGGETVFKTSNKGMEASSRVNIDDDATSIIANNVDPVTLENIADPDSESSPTNAILGIQYGGSQFNGVEATVDSLNLKGNVLVNGQPLGGPKIQVMDSSAYDASTADPTTIYLLK